MENQSAPDAPLAGIEMGSSLDALSRAKRELRRALEINPLLFEERRDQELNALIAANHVCDWVFPDLSPVTRAELASRYLSPGQKVEDAGHLAHLLSLHVRSFKLARRIANVTKHRQLRVARPPPAAFTIGPGTYSFAFPTGGDYPPIRFIKVIDQDDGSRYRASDIAQRVITFWEDFFSDPVGSIERAKQ